MGAPKFKTSDLSKLYPRTEAKVESQNLRDKELIEALKERLNQKFQNDPAFGKKAALVLEHWLKSK